MSASSSSSISSKLPPDAPTGPKALRYSSRMSSRSRLHPNPKSWNSAPSPSVPRQSSSPLVHSPLQQSFLMDGDSSKSAPSSPRLTTQETPPRLSRLSEQGKRPRGESRSSSVPIIIRAPQETKIEVENTVPRPFGPRTRPKSCASSSLPSPADTQDGQGRRNVKHLTCFWWWEKGECKYAEEECRMSYHPISKSSSCFWAIAYIRLQFMHIATRVIILPLHANLPQVSQRKQADHSSEP